MFSKLGALSALVLFVGALNLSAVQDWDVPLIGIENAEATVGLCIDNPTRCCDPGPGPGNCTWYNDCVRPYRHGWVSCSCNGGGSC